MQPNKFNITKEEILEYHLGGKIGLNILKSLSNQRDLSIAYTPGVAAICEEIHNDEEKAYSLTSKGNLVAVVTDGTAVLGLGNIGPKASIPVMEGKAILFKTFADVDAWPVPLEGVINPATERTDIQKLVETTSRLSCMYGGINLEDIAGPECFDVEDQLQEMLDIPVFHDDQWGTAIITLAALKNYCVITGKNIKNLSIVINGAGAAGLRIADMIKTEGGTKIMICDSKGILTVNRNDLNLHKKKHAVSTGLKTLADAMKNADVFIGVSVADCVTGEMVETMSEYPAIFAMANPVPEIMPEIVEKAMKGRKYIMATGRSDYPNQINNVLGFPFIFRGALDVRAKRITMGMKIAASSALAELARIGNVPEKVKKAYNRDFTFGPDYLIPTPFDPRIKEWESKRVALTAIKEGVARLKEVPEYNSRTNEK
ncbi:malate dehydrogenase [Candidatus Omnitrophus magneticus]|uniref:Malate dehydrogenase n=1 Tax=Candidatus Omnitrophus magneticus TaxID=1609969 RepID=A0A0F0CNC6_9BACT|nr:malate dehydrogenase [Candidatus Omnitrophus magneticus]KJJ85725.1 malate dehydrogenase [Candidatus Omnitrophus magneticus]